MADETPKVPGESLIFPKCGAETKQDGHEPCQNPAGLRTATPGKGRCYLHGGVQPNDGRLGYIRYSRRMTEKFNALQVELEADPDPLDMLPEIAALRVLYIDWVNRYDEYVDALVAWHFSFVTEGKVPKPTKIMDISEGYKMLDTIGKMIERVEAIKQRRVIAIVSPEVQERVHAQVTLIGARKQWTSEELLVALSDVWK